MAANCVLTPPRRIRNLLATTWVRLGLPPRKYHLLTVRGRKSGRSYSTPVTIIEDNGQRWLVAPFGEREWVKNVRVTGQIALRRGRRSETAIAIEELDPVKSAPILKRYINEEPITCKFFAATPCSPLEDFVQEANRHPVFRILSH